MLINSKQKPGNAPHRAEVFVDPRSDFGFKKIFGEEDGKEDLIRMLNAFIGDMAPPIESIEHLDREQLGATKHQRKAVYDLYIKDQKNCSYNVEMQNQPILHPVDRQFSYICKAVTASLKKGKEEKFKLNPAMGVFIANFNIIDAPGSDAITLIQYHSEKPGMPTPPAQILTVELPNFNKKIEELKTEKDVYLFLLNNLASLQEIPAALDTKKYRPLFERAKIANLKKDEMTYYDRLRKQEETKQLELDYALERGEKQGIERGIVKGKIESSKQTAKRLLETTGFSFDRVAELTSLTLQQVKQIKRGRRINTKNELTIA